MLNTFMMRLCHSLLPQMTTSLLASPKALVVAAKKVLIEKVTGYTFIDCHQILGNSRCRGQSLVETSKGTNTVEVEKLPSINVTRSAKRGLIAFRNIQV